jgi:hypothetical protein
MAKQSRNSEKQPIQAGVVTTSDKRVITIRALEGGILFEADVKFPERLERLAQEWSYVLRARSRWTADPELRKSIAARALADLGSVGILPQQVQSLASADRIEVELHDWNRQDPKESRIHEAAAEVPWEYLISAATRSEGRFRPLLISRLFSNGMSAVTPSPPRSVLFVESAPGRIEELYEFDDEEERISAAVGAAEKPAKYWKILATPQVSELKEAVENTNWEAIHVTGVDTHQAGWFIEDFYADLKKNKPDIFKALIDATGRLQDGMILRQGRESELPVLYDELAQILTGATPPRIVTLNLYYSGARIARELIRAGAHVALGFLDEINDELAELFFQAFYWQWCHPQNDVLSIPDAFLKAWEKMGGSELHGTSIVIWMGRSVFAPQADTRIKIRRSKPSTRKKVAR